MIVGTAARRVVAVTLGMVGAIALAFGVVLVFFWIMDQGGPTAGGPFLLGGIALGALGGMSLLLSRLVRHPQSPRVARDTPNT